MKKIIDTVKKTFGTKKDRGKDPIYDFFVHGSSANKEKVYTRALERADADQKKIIDEYNKRLKLHS
jgi:hypothetical protein